MSGAGETFYSSISTQASSQLKARENLVSAEYKTAEQLNYLNSNTGFIKVTSGVNTLTDDGGTSSYLASRVILYNGTAFKEGSGVGLRSGIDYKKETSFTSGDKAYNNYNSLFNIL